jgi:hypothetical protein
VTLVLTTATFAAEQEALVRRFIGVNSRLLDNGSALLLRRGVQFSVSIAGVGVCL